MACIEAITLPAGAAARPSSARLPWAMRPATSASSAGSAPRARARLRVSMKATTRPAITATAIKAALARFRLSARV
jgi:hypothetical protein